MHPSCLSRFTLMRFTQGTPPFMAIELLKEGPPHLVVYDVSWWHRLRQRG
jgi:hypothetical protein